MLGLAWLLVIVVWWLVWVGVLCENCIVDVSIFIFLCVVFLLLVRAHGGCLGMLSR